MMIKAVRSAISRLNDEERDICPYILFKEVMKTIKLKRISLKAVRLLFLEN